MFTCYMIRSETLLSISLDIYPEVELIGSSGNSFFDVFLRNRETGFHSSCIIFTFLLAVLSISVSPHPCQHLLSIVYNSHSDRYKPAFVVLIYISLIISDVNHFFISLLAVCMSLGKFLFKPFAHI